MSYYQRPDLCRLRLPIGLLGSAIASLTLAAPALAHHGMDNRLPTNLWEGFISGLAHPIIGLDHLAFLVIIGWLAATQRQAWILPLSFTLATLAGTGLHLSSLTLPVPELFVAGSVLLFGLLLAIGRQLSPVATVWLAAAAGLFHGYAYAEAIIGAETTLLVAYVLGFTVIQLTVSLMTYGLVRRSMI